MSIFILNISKLYYYIKSFANFELFIDYYYKCYHFKMKYLHLFLFKSLIKGNSYHR